MGLDMYFEGTFSTRAFAQKSEDNFDKKPSQLILTLKLLLNLLALKTLQLNLLTGIIIQLIFLLLIGEKLIVFTTGSLKTFRVVTITVIVIM